MAGPDLVSLLDWKRRVFELYRDARRSSPGGGWGRWRAGGDGLFARPPQPPIPEEERPSFSGLPYFDYDPGARVAADVVPVEPATLELPTSGTEPYRFTRFAQAEFELSRRALTLDVYWLEGYGGGLYVPFADATSGSGTYGAGRYLLDTVKGADLGMDGDRLVLDFNLAYNPSCAYDPRFVCPLAPPANRLAVEVRAGERFADRDTSADFGG